MLMASLNHHESKTLRDCITFQISDKFLIEMEYLSKLTEIILGEAISVLVSVFKFYFCMHRLLNFCLFWKFPYLTFEKEKSNNMCFVATLLESFKTNKLLTFVQYSCIGWVILWLLYRPPFPAKKHSWHMSKLKHLRHRYLGKKIFASFSSFIHILRHETCKSIYLNPKIGFCLQMLHFAWCFAVSAAVNLQ